LDHLTWHERIKLKSHAYNSKQFTYIIVLLQLVDSSPLTLTAACSSICVPGVPESSKHWQLPLSDCTDNSKYYTLLFFFSKDIYA